MEKKRPSQILKDQIAAGKLTTPVDRMPGISYDVPRLAVNIDEEWLAKFVDERIKKELKRISVRSAFKP